MGVPGTKGRRGHEGPHVVGRLVGHQDASRLCAVFNPSEETKEGE